jgi:hypothetical protein
MRFNIFSVLGLSVICLCSGVAFGAAPKVTTAAKAVDPQLGAKAKGALTGGTVAVPTAALTFTCANGTSFKVSTGSSSGSCSLVKDGTTTTGANCVNSSSQLAVATCSSGCVLAQNSGTCAPVK